MVLSIHEQPQQYKCYTNFVDPEEYKRSLRIEEKITKGEMEPERAQAIVWKR